MPGAASEGATEALTTGATTGAATGSAGDPPTTGVTGGVTPSCGDGVLDLGEVCDDGNRDDGDACVAGCVPAACGDGFVQAGVEECDDGNDDGSDSCPGTCMAARCGDGFVQAGVEECDDGDDDDSDACPNTCDAARCGDGFVHAGVEECDDGNSDDSDECPGTCMEARCGDGFVQDGVEECDDGNDSDSDGCVLGCTVAVCGDGVVHAGVEACDDGDDDDADGCLSTCAEATCGDGVVREGVEECDDGDVDNVDGCLSTCEKARSCAAIYAASPQVASGVYTLDTGQELFLAYCDMKSDGGGWTLIARFANGDARNWMLDTGEWWYSRTEAAGLPTKHNDQYDAMSPAFYQVTAEEIKLARSDDLDDGYLLRTSGGCLGGTTFRAHITSFGDFQDGVAWADNKALNTCEADLGGSWMATNGFAFATCTGDIGAPSSISFWADWGAGDGAVMMIGGGGAGCSGADHGIGITEANAANFAFGSFEDDFGVEGSDAANNNTYALNLFVR